MWVWQSQAPGGTSKFTGVAGCDALARLAPARQSKPPASVPATNRRLVSIGTSYQGKFQRPARDQLVLVEQRAARGTKLFIFLFQTFKAAITPGRAGIERQDGVTREHEPAAQ